MPYRPMAYAAFGVAGAALVGTIVWSVFAARESQPTCDKPDPRHACPEIYSGNRGPAIGLGLITAVSAVAGGVLLYLDHRSQKRATVMVAPTQGGAAATASLTF